MLILGLETSCDETAAAVVRDGAAVLSNVVASQHDLHAEYAGVVPEIASRAHVEAILPVIRRALEEAGVGLGMIDAIAVGNRPGLIGSLLVGVGAAKALAWSLGKPLIGVDHVRAHLASGVLHAHEHPPTVRADELFPALGLVVSGGHTALFEVESFSRVQRLGSTIDDALGEAYDKVAALLGLPHPGGPNLDRLASAPGANERAFELPVARLAPSSLDFSFSGLKTSVRYAVQGVPSERSAHAAPTLDLRSPAHVRDMAASFQRAASRAVILKLERALGMLRASVASGPPRALLTGGGVTANSRLRAELLALGQREGLRVVLPAMEYCMDNAAMVAGLAYHLHRAGQRDDLSLQALPTATGDA